MDHKGITLTREKGKDVPALVLESALLHCNAMVSVAFAHAPDGKPTIELMDQNLKEVTHPQGALGYVKDLLEETKDYKILLHLSNDPKDAQPFTILSDEGIVMLVASLVGDFSEHKETDGHSVEYIEADDYLTPKILDLFEKADDDVPKLMQKLREPNITRELGKMGEGEFLNCTVLASNGDMLAFTRPKSPPLKYEWGSASCDLNEHQAAATATEKKETVVEPVKLTLKERLAAKAAAKAADGTGKPDGTPGTKSPPGTTPAETKPIPDGGPTIPDGKPATGTPLADLKARLLAKKGVPVVDTARSKETQATNNPALAADPYRLVDIPVTFSKERLKRNWFAARGPSGEVNIDFPDWKHRQGQIVVPTSRIAALHKNLDMAEIMKRYPIASPADITRLKGGAMAMKSTTQTSVPAVAHAQGSTVPGFISPEAKEKLHSRVFSQPHVIAVVAKNGQNILNPDFLPQMEDKLPQFWQSLGLPNVNASDWWKHREYMDVGKEDISSLAKIAFDEKMNRCRQEKRIIELEARIINLQGGVKPEGESLPAGPPWTPATTTEPAKLSLKERMALKKKAA